MFTGLIEDVGGVVSLRRSSAGARLKVKTKLGPLVPGESIAAFELGEEEGGRLRVVPHVRAVKGAAA